MGEPVIALAELVEAGVMKWTAVANHADNDLAGLAGPERKEPLRPPMNGFRLKEKDCHNFEVTGMFEAAHQYFVSQARLFPALGSLGLRHSTRRRRFRIAAGCE